MSRTRWLLLVSLVTAWLPGVLRTPILRACGVALGPGARVGFGAILAGKRVALGRGARILPMTLVMADEIQLGARARIGPVTMIRVRKLALGPFARIGALTIASGRERFFLRSSLTLGTNARIFPLCWIDCGQNVHVGKDSCLGGGTHVFTHGSFLSYLEGYPVNSGNVHVGDNVYVAWRCVLLPGTRLDGDAVVGAKSLVRGNFPRGVLVAGSPAKILRQPYPPALSETERNERLLEVLTRVAEVLEGMGESVAREQLSAEGFSLTWRSAPQGTQRLEWQPRPDAAPAREGTIVVVDGAPPPEEGSYVDAAERRYRFAKRERALGEVVRRIFHYHGIRLTEQLED